jgi:hypothetical protein
VSEISLSTVKHFLALKLRPTGCVSFLKSLLKQKRIGMKNVLFLGLILTLFAAAASAQQMASPRLHHQREMQSFHRRNLNRAELRRLHKDEVRYKMARRKVEADGIVTRAERRRLNKIRMHNRRELYRLNHHKQVI